MRLVLNLAAPWTACAPAVGEVLAFAREDVPARLHTTPLYDPFAPPAQVAGEVVGERATMSAGGWPVRVIERIVRADGAPPRCELDVRYRFFELAAAVVVTGPADAITRHRDEVLAAALAGRPDWTGEPVCLAELMPPP